jgi:hypothetical protein
MFFIEIWADELVTRICYFHLFSLSNLFVWTVGNFLLVQGLVEPEGSLICVVQRWHFMNRRTSHHRCSNGIQIGLSPVSEFPPNMPTLRNCSSTADIRYRKNSMVWYLKAEITRQSERESFYPTSDADRSAQNCGKRKWVLPEQFGPKCTEWILVLFWNS